MALYNLLIITIISSSNIKNVQLNLMAKFNAIDYTAGVDLWKNICWKLVVEVVGSLAVVW